LNTASIPQTSPLEAYLSIERLIYHIVFKFQKSHGGDFDDLFQEANLIFLQSYSSFNHSLSALSTYAWTCVWRGLSEYHRKEKKQKAIRPYNESILESGYYHRFSLYILTESMSNDAKDLVTLILDPPNDIKEKTLKNGTKPYDLASIVKKHLNYKLGWTGKRIRETFEEIKEILCT